MKRQSTLRCRAIGLAGAVATLSVTSGCGDIANMAFVQDERVKFVQPADRSTATIPVKLRWQVNGFQITGHDGRREPGAGSFALFIDQPPMPPGETFEWLARDDHSCSGDQCAKKQYLSERSVYVTEKTEVTLNQLPDIDDVGGKERHEAVLVLLDGSGHRIGESAFYVRFIFDREGLSGE